jgi:endoglucanase
MKMKQPSIKKATRSSSRTLGVAGIAFTCLATGQALQAAESSSARAMIGVNWAGAEFAPRNLPGVENRDFGWPTAESLDYWKSKGVLLIRLPFSWERLQPALQGELAPDYLAGLKRSVGLIRERKMRMVLDLHNYGKYRGQLIGSETVPVEAFADVWRRLAGEFKDNPAISGYGLMNEPACKPWVDKVQAAIDAIRAVDA